MLIHFDILSRLRAHTTFAAMAVRDELELELEAIMEEEAMTGNEIQNPQVQPEDENPPKRLRGRNLLPGMDCIRFCLDDLLLL